MIKKPKKTPNKQLQEVCHRCGKMDVRKNMYHSQFKFVPFWFCNDRKGCEKRQEAEKNWKPNKLHAAINQTAAFIKPNASS